MSIQPANYLTLLDGAPVTTDSLMPLAFSGFAHFTAMQVRDRKVKGIDLHLARLREASLKLYGVAQPDEQVLQGIRRTIADGPADQSLSVTVYSPAGEFTAGSMGVEPSILVRTGQPSDGPSGPVRLSVVEHERFLPAIKHVGEGAKTYFLRRAVEQGFDDAAFTDRLGRLSEATIWNLVFWDGSAVVWPEAAILKGTMMGIVQRQMRRLDVPQRYEQIRPADVADFSAAAIMNSWTPGVAVTAIGYNAIGESKPFMALLHDAYQAEPALMVP